MDSATKYLALAFVVVLAVVVADSFAHRDEVAGRRYKDLPPAVVQSLADLGHNSQWHFLGAIQRLLCMVLVAQVVFFWLDRNWLAAGLALLTGGGLVLAGFDLLFNTRSGLPWDYVGTTAKTDVAATGRRRAALVLKAALVCAGISGWVLLL